MIWGVKPRLIFGNITPYFFGEALMYAGDMNLANPRWSLPPRPRIRIRGGQQMRQEQIRRICDIIGDECGRFSD